MHYSVKDEVPQLQKFSTRSLNLVEILKIPSKKKMNTVKPCNKNKKKRQLRFQDPSEIPSWDVRDSDKLRLWAPFGKGGTCFLKVIMLAGTLNAIKAR